MKIICGNSLEELKTLEPNSVDSIVTDPPYGLSFMGKKWDYDVPSVDIWKECLRVLKPGGYLLSFAGTRTQHRMAVNIEDAGFEIRDMIAWVYGSGFPKSLNIANAIAKRDGAGTTGNTFPIQNEYREYTLTDSAKQWEGWGTALKPALEPITVARKPLAEKTVAENVLKYGTGGMNIDGSRVGTEERYNAPAGNKEGGNSLNMSATGMPQGVDGTTAIGRFPANLIHDGSDEVVSLFPDTKSGKMNAGQKRNSKPLFGGERDFINETIGDSGSAARFFYCAKASKADRDEGLDGEEVEVRGGGGRVADGYTEDQADLKQAASAYGALKAAKKNIHPTVKPTKLMQYLVKLVTPKGGTVLDPFMGSGSTGKACKLEGFDFIGIELEEEYIKIAEARINAIKPTLL